jgi:hypothetical protein
METEIELCADGVTKPVFQLLDGHPAAARCIVFSGSPALWEEMQTLGCPQHVRLGANIRYFTEDTLECFEDLPLFEVGLNAHHYTAQDVEQLRAHGIEVLANLGDSPAWWAELSQTGCYGFKTNFSGAYLAWKERQA